MCPVYTFELYLRLLNDGNDSLFQRAKIGYQVNDGACMYVNAKAGRDKLALMMSVMSTSAGLSKRYTNHCVRATCVSLLDENYDPTQIMGISMHKSLSSILSYRGRVKRSKKREMSRSLTKACMQQVSDESSNDVSFMAESTSSDVMVMAESTAADVNLMTEQSSSGTNFQIDQGSTANESVFGAQMVPSDAFDSHMDDPEMDSIMQSIDLHQISRSSNVMQAPVLIYLARWLYTTTITPIRPNGHELAIFTC